MHFLSTSGSANNPCRLCSLRVGIAMRTDGIDLCRAKQSQWRNRQILPKAIADSLLCTDWLCGPNPLLQLPPLLLPLQLLQLLLLCLYASNGPVMQELPTHCTSGAFGTPAWVQLFWPLMASETLPSDTSTARPLATQVLEALLPTQAPEAAGNQGSTRTSLCRCLLQPEESASFAWVSG